MRLLLLVSIFTYSCGDVDADTNIEKVVIKDQGNKGKKDENLPVKTELAEENTYFYPYEHSDITLSTGMKPGQVRFDFERNEHEDTYKIAYQLSSYPENCDDGENFVEDSLPDETIDNLEEGKTYFFRLCAVSEEGEMSKGIKGKLKTLTLHQLSFTLNITAVLYGQDSVKTHHQINVLHTPEFATHFVVRYSNWTVKPAPFTMRDYFELEPLTDCNEFGNPRVEWFEIAIVNQHGEQGEWYRYDIPDNHTHCLTMP